MSVEHCPVCEGSPRVLVAIQHPGMRRYTRELLERECHCWVAAETTGTDLVETLGWTAPDLLVVDDADFPRGCRGELVRFPGVRVIVIGPEPDSSYRAAALAQGAGAWIPRERVGEELGPQMRSVLGCVHDPCPPGERTNPAPGHDASRSSLRASADDESWVGPDVPSPSGSARSS